MNEVDMDGDQSGDNVDHRAVLSPRPDPQTGQPIPPHAPGFVANSSKTKTSCPPPKPPPDMGPALAWSREPWKSKFADVAVSTVVVLVLTSSVSLVQGDGFAILTYWQTWVGVVFFIYCMADPFTRRVFSVGADWMQWSYITAPWSIRRKSRYVELYRLCRIHGYIPKFSGAHLRLLDLTGRVLDANVKRFQGNQQTWDFLYNGVLYSIADGAEISHDAVNIFRLASHPIFAQAHVY